MTKPTPMPAATLKALKASIAHWRRMADGKAHGGEEPYGEHCALCDMFLNEFNRCTGCPVATRTGEIDCNNTPYWKARNAWDDYGRDSKHFRAAARKELAFLKSLLPKGKK